jgi:WD40 repeat protein
VRRKAACYRCRKGNTGVPQTIASWLKAKKTTRSVSSIPENLNKPRTSRTSRGLLQSQQTRRSTQRRLTLTPTHSAITPTQPVTRTISQPSDIAATSCQIVSLPSTSKPSATTVDPDSGTEEVGCTTSLNNKVGKELNVEVINTLFHERTICRVKFSQDGKYLAAGCLDGKAYVYDISEGGILLWHVLDSVPLELSLICSTYPVFSRICLRKRAISTPYVSAMTESTSPPVHRRDTSM